MSSPSLYTKYHKATPNINVPKTHLCAYPRCQKQLQLKNARGGAHAGEFYLKCSSQTHPWFWHFFGPNVAPANGPPTALLLALVPVLPPAPPPPHPFAHLAQVIAAAAAVPQPRPKCLLCHKSTSTRCPRQWCKTHCNDRQEVRCQAHATQGPAQFPFGDFATWNAQPAQVASRQAARQREIQAELESTFPLPPSSSSSPTRILSSSSTPSLRPSTSSSSIIDLTMDNDNDNDDNDNDTSRSIIDLSEDEPVAVGKGKGKARTSRLLPSWLMLVLILVFACNALHFE
ncbi:hypothetical protein C8F01DRAFT_337259 [Mycena amicta]|nr:hypothetical protein C8F01DRAFT_337259 [Mycena amicta]